MTTIGWALSFGSAFSASSGLYDSCQQLEGLYTYRLLSSGRVMDLPTMPNETQDSFRSLQCDT